MRGTQRTEHCSGLPYESDDHLRHRYTARWKEIERKAMGKRYVDDTTSTAWCDRHKC